MPEEVEDCVDSVLEDNPDYSESRAYAICHAQNKGYDDPEAFAAVAMKTDEGQWPGIHPAEKTSDGRERLMNVYGEDAKSFVEPETETVKFKADLAGPGAIFKVSDGDDDRFVIWGKASVEVVDKEKDKITAEALKSALPQLLRRERLSLKHSDQLVGDIKESFETEEPVTVEISGKEYTRKSFPTDVLQMEDEEPALFVAGEIWEDTRQARQTRKDIEEGKIDSYSISGEAISSSTKVKDGDVYDEIVELDLSAVTLCEEGMNQEAKFGTVVKLDGDDPTPVQGQASTPAVAVVKSDNQHMTEDTNEGTLTREDLRSEFEKAAQDALDEADFVTTEEMKSYVDQQVSKAHEDEEEEDSPDNASQAAAESDDEEEKAEVPEDEDEEEDPDGSETPVDPEDDEDTPDDKGDVDPDEIEDPDDDQQEEVDLDPTEDEDMPPEEGYEEEEDEEKAGYTEEELESQLPSDLYESIMEHLGGGDEQEVSPEVEPEEDVDVVEAEDDTEKGEEPVSGENLGGDLDKAQTDEEYLEMTASIAAPTPDEDEDLIKSFERKDGEVEGEASVLSALYEDMEESYEA